jgi:isoquinoline 1-oxidoreductase subunit beta
VGSFDRAAVRQVQGEGEHLLAGWIKIGADDTVTIYIPHVDMGQGTHTALAMLAAEELDADWARVRTERAPAEKTFANRFLARGWIIADRTFPLVDGLIETVFVEAARQMNLQITGGSTAVRMTGRFGMRQVGAAAKFMLISAAAERWGVPAARLTVRDGVVTDATSGRSARFGELAEAAARQRVPADAPLKKPADWRLVGTSPGRLDIPAKTDGSFAYGIDFTLPDMLHAAVRSAPVHGGRLIRVDPAPAREMPGVVRVGGRRARRSTRSRRNLTAAARGSRTRPDWRRSRTAHSLPRAKAWRAKAPRKPRSLLPRLSGWSRSNTAFPTCTTPRWSR